MAKCTFTGFELFVELVGIRFAGWFCGASDFALSHSVIWILIAGSCGAASITDD